MVAGRVGALACGIALAWPVAARAQVGQVGTRIGRGSAAGTVANSPDRGTSTAAGAAITITTPPRIDNVDSATPRLVAGDTGIAALPTRACGSARACAPGAAWRIANLTLPGTVLPVDGTVHLGFEVENAGRAPAPGAPVRICLVGAGIITEACGYPLGTLDVPTLAPGARVRVGRLVHLPPLTPDLVWAVAVVVNPDARQGGSHNGAVARSAAVRVVGPELEWLAVEPGALMSDGRLPVHLRVRNRSDIAVAPATPVTINGVPLQWARRGGVTSRYDVELPPLAPHGTWEADVVVATGQTCAGVRPGTYTGFVQVSVPRGAGLWGHAHQAHGESAPFQRVCP